MRRCNCLPPLDDWNGGKPDAWDYEAVLRDNGMVVEWCHKLTSDGETFEPAPSDLCGWNFYWKRDSIHIGQCVEKVARKAAPLVSLWLRGVSASVCDKIMSGMIWFWEWQQRPSQVRTLNQLDLAPAALLPTSAGRSVVA